MKDSLFSLWNLNIILESLPISSSGHLYLITHLLQGRAHKIRSTIEHLMHIPNGIIISIFLALTMSQLNFSQEALCSYTTSIIITNVLTGLAYGTLKSFFERVPLALGFFCSGVALLSLPYAPVPMLNEVSLLHAFYIGIAQCCALAPGVSRMALTTSTGILLGINPLLSFSYSLACELGLIIVACAVAVYTEKDFSLFRLSLIQVILVCISTFISYKALLFSALSFTHHAGTLMGAYLVLVSGFVAWYTFSSRP